MRDLLTELEDEVLALKCFTDTIAGVADAQRDEFVSNQIYGIHYFMEDKHKKLKKILNGLFSEKRGSENE